MAHPPMRLPVLQPRTCLLHVVRSGACPMPDGESESESRRQTTRHEQPLPPGQARQSQARPGQLSGGRSVAGGGSRRWEETSRPPELNGWRFPTGPVGSRKKHLRRLGNFLRAHPEAVVVGFCCTSQKGRPDPVALGHRNFSLCDPARTADSSSLPVCWDPTGVAKAKKYFDRTHIAAEPSSPKKKKRRKTTALFFLLHVATRARVRTARLRGPLRVFVSLSSQWLDWRGSLASRCPRRADEGGSRERLDDTGLAWTRRAWTRLDGTRLD